MTNDQLKIMNRVVNPVHDQVRVTNSGLILIERKQDAEPIFDDNLKHRNAQPNKGQRFKGPLTCVAHIPTVMVEQWMKEGLNIFDPDQKDELHKKLNDRDYRKLRVVEGLI